MKKNSRQRGFLLSLALLLALACTAQAQGLPAVQPGAPLYSNLADEDALNGVLSALNQAGLDPETVSQVGDWVRDYNQLAQGNPAYSVTGAFAPMTEGFVDYGEDQAVYADYNYQWWKRARRDYYDVLCRSTAYFLLDGMIQVAHPLPEDQWAVDSWLETDYDGFESNPRLSFSEGGKAAYFTLFAPIDLGGITAAGDMAALIQRTWRQRGVSFAPGKASLLTVWIPSQGQTAAGHAALLVELDQGFLLFEKTNPEYPYQATLFAAMDEARDYLIASMQAAYRGDDMAPDPIVVFLNDRPL